MTSFVASSDSDFDDEVRPPAESGLSAGLKGVGNDTARIRTPHDSSRVSASQDAVVIAAPEGSLEDPDWVKQFTPNREPSRTETRRRKRISQGMETRNKDGFQASKFDQGEFRESSDSILDLVSDESMSASDLPEAGPEQHDVDIDGSSQCSGRLLASSTEKQTRVKSSLPLITASKLDENLVLVQAQSEAFDLSGDVGAVGRVKIDANGMFLDIKGVLYSCGVMPINTVCVVSVDDSEARVTAALDEVVTLDEDRSVLNSGEQVLSGTIEDDIVEQHVDGEEPAVVRTQNSAKAKGTKSQKASSRISKKAKPKSRSSKTGKKA